MTATQDPGSSSGLREVMTLASTTTGSSAQFAPALIRSWRMTTKLVLQRHLSSRESF